MNISSAATVLGLSNFLAGHAVTDTRPRREFLATLSAGTDLDDSFAPLAFDRAGAANTPVTSEAVRQASAAATGLALAVVLARVTAGVSADQERSLATELVSGQVGPAAVRLLTECIDSPAARLSAKRFAVLALGAFGDGRALRKALQSGQPALTEAALNAIDWWNLPGFETELRALAEGDSAHWVREYAEDLLG